MKWALGERWIRLRLIGGGAVFVLCFGVLAWRAWVLEVRESKRLRDMAEQQYLHDVELPSRRGRIFDRNGAELAASVEVDSVYVNPRQIEARGNKEEIVAALGRTLHLERRDLLKILGGRRHFAWVKRHVLPQEAREVRELGLVGVYWMREPRRYYPNRSLAGPLLGWAGIDGRGLEGIELRYDKQLRGAPLEIQGLRDALGREVLAAGGVDAAPRTGHELWTTIDRFIQYRLERALEAGVQKSRAKAGLAVALDPANGDVLAMAAVPTVNPNDPAGAEGRGVRNRAITDPFEPGSTMKTFSIAAAVAAGLVRPDERWFCENGKYPIGPAVIHDAESIGAATTTEVLAQSSNICTAKIAFRSGRERVDTMLRRFGFGVPSGIDLPGERGGLLRPASKWGPVELATIAFGQGITATPLQVAAAYAAIANGGTLYRPHVVKRITDERGRTVATVEPQGRRIVEEKTAATMRGMLAAVLQAGGTGEKLAIPGYPGGGKTGTAQKVDPATRRYSADKWASSFVGFAPLERPRIVLFVMVDEPQGTHFGSMVAGPVWHEVTAEALRYLNVPPVGEAVATAARSSAPLSERSDEAPIEAAPEKTSTATDEEVTLGEAPGIEIPNFVGLSMGQALALARRARLRLEVVGSGRAVSQIPEPGLMRRRSMCRVSFVPPG